MDLTFAASETAEKPGEICTYGGLSRMNFATNTRGRRARLV